MTSFMSISPHQNLPPRGALPPGVPSLRAPGTAPRTLTGSVLGASFLRTGACADSVLPKEALHRGRYLGPAAQPLLHGLGLEFRFLRVLGRIVASEDLEETTVSWAPGIDGNEPVVRFLLSTCACQPDFDSHANASTSRLGSRGFVSAGNAGPVLSSTFHSVASSSCGPGRIA